jgi:hypothetical protein
VELWRAEPGDVVRLPASCWPRTVIVTGCDGTSSGPDFNRLSWEDDEGARGSLVLPDTLEVGLLYTGREDKRPFLSPASALTET